MSFSPTPLKEVASDGGIWLLLHQSETVGVLIDWERMLSSSLSQLATWEVWGFEGCLGSFGLLFSRGTGGDFGTCGSPWRGDLSGSIWKCSEYRAHLRAAFSCSVKVYLFYALFTLFSQPAPWPFYCFLSHFSPFSTVVPAPS
eukprot:TRINITY_DN14677_c0_g2_i1.p1 TRINITY_DN14677_c0_g2~~TRINITY_DN14677_c0_g2_i1.p1  ORF type:complete len:143 (-),score=7.62 TRINITY_DN14677_c0_g2_i1:406-834(-)